MRPALFAVLVFAALLGVSSLAVVYVKHESRQLFVELQEAVATRDRLNVEWGMLQLEQGAWATHGRIEQLARERLDMRMPRRGDVIIVKQ